MGIGSMRLLNLTGWMLIGFAMLLASGDALAALTPGVQGYIAAGDLWALLTGVNGTGKGGLVAMIADFLLNLPAWVVAGVIGFSLVSSVRPKKRRFHGKVRYYN